MKRVVKLVSMLAVLLHITKLTLSVLYARTLSRKIVFFMGTPKHTNLGDQAITFAGMEFVRSRIPNTSVRAISLPLILQKDISFLRWLIRDVDVLVGLGGGNMGDVYLAEEECRRTFIGLFPKNKIIIFPQTIHFSDTAKGRAELAKSRKVYSQHADLTIIAREKTSYEKMKVVFNHNNVLLTPDIVLSTHPRTSRHRRRGVLLCLRDDLEGALSLDDKDRIIGFAHKHFQRVTSTDTIANTRFFRYKLKRVVLNAKLNEFRKAELVITDRLHGMVFAAITGTPCIALASFNHKVAMTYGWIEHLPYVYFCNDSAELERVFESLDTSVAYVYDPNYFASYWAEIESYFNAR